MIPTVAACKSMWDEFLVNEKRRVHMETVARLAAGIAKRISAPRVNIELLTAAALLHDADKSMPKFDGEKHPELMVRALQEQGMGEVGEVVRTHSLPAILHPETAPKTIEQKILFLSDKMAKYEVTGVDARFDLWRSEHLPLQDRVLAATYGPVKQLEKEISFLAGIDLSDRDKLIDIFGSSVI
jgi:hypothetical protein